MSPLLTICIATYNRAECLVDTLRSIMAQLRTIDDVEVLVVDGNSTDNTESVVKQLQMECRYLHYMKLPEKGGVDKDFDIAVRSASGRYCWVFTDDDLLKEHAVSTVRNAITQGADLIIVNAEICDYDMAHVLKKRALQVESNVQMDLSPAGREAFFQRCATYITFIGAIVIRKDAWVQSPSQHFYGTRFIHVGVISTLHDTTNVLILSEPLIRIRLGNAEWSHITFKVWTQLWPQLIWSFSNLSVECKKAICRLEPWKNVKALLWFRALGVYAKKEYCELIRQSPMSAYKAAALFTACLPRCIPRGLFYAHALYHSDTLKRYYLGAGGKSKNSWSSE